MRVLLRFATTIAAAAAGLPLLTAADPAPKPLVLDQVHRSSARRDVVDPYSIELAAGMFAEVAVQGLGQDVAMEALGPDGQTLTEIASQDGNHAPNRLLVLAEKPGRYTVGVAARLSGQEQGAYELRLVALRPATPTDRLRHEAQQLVHQAASEFWAHREDAARTRALPKLDQALVLYRQTGDELGELKTLMHLIVMHRTGGRDYASVIRFADASIALARKLGNRGAEAHGLFQRGAALVLTGEGRRGLDEAKESLAIWRELKHEFGEAFVLNQLSGLYNHVGDTVRAAEYIDQTLAVSKRSGNNQLYFGALLGKAGVLLPRRKFQEALPLLEEALPYYQRIGDLDNQAFIEARLGRVHAGLGDKTAAVAHFERALEVNRKVKNPTTQANTLYSLAERMQEIGNLDRAVELASEATAIRERTGVPTAHAGALGLLTNLERQRGNLEASLRHIAAATRMLDSERSRLGSTGLRATNLASIYGAYGSHIESLRLLHERGHGVAAGAAAQGDWLNQSFAIAENLRARGWMETLALAKVNLREGADAALVADEAALRKKVDEKAAEQRRLLAANASAAELDRAAREFRTLTDQYDELEGRLRLSSPRLAELTQAQPVSIAEVRQMLDSGTALLEYFIGTNRSYVWAITQDAAALAPLGDGDEIEKLAARAYSLIAARNESPAGEPAEARARRLAEADAALPAALEALNARVLSLPALETALAGKKRWLIVPDGPLHLVPVAALPGAAGREVVYLPSATALRAIRAQAAARKAPPRLAAIVADPVFDASDPRVTGKPASAQPLDVNLARRAIEPFGLAGSDGRIPRLLFTRREAETIAAVAPPGASAARKVTDFAASRDLVLGPDLASYRVVHFATHGLLNSQSPELSGLLLSLVDPQGKPRDGLVQLRDIYSLRLPADLVVMSACQTALGKELRGEGVVGLTRGMLFAGASRVVSSLWKVDDAATAELMKLFYAAMWREKLAPAAALHAAQTRLAAQRRWQAPYYWAGFVLQGEYR